MSQLVGITTAALLLSVSAHAASEAGADGSPDLANLKASISRMQTDEATALAAYQEAVRLNSVGDIARARGYLSTTSRIAEYANTTISSLEQDYQALSPSDRQQPLAALHEISKLIARAVSADSVVSDTGNKLSTALADDDSRAAATDLSAIETVEAGATRQKDKALADAKKLPEPPAKGLSCTYSAQAPGALGAPVSVMIKCTPTPFPEGVTAAVTVPGHALSMVDGESGSTVASPCSISGETETCGPSSKTFADVDTVSLNYADVSGETTEGPCPATIDVKLLEGTKVVASGSTSLVCGPP
jgi:hypothetical protein